MTKNELVKFLNPVIANAEAGKNSYAKKVCAELKKMLNTINGQQEITKGNVSELFDENKNDYSKTAYKIICVSVA